MTTQVDVTKLQLINSEQPMAVVEVSSPATPLGIVASVRITFNIKATASVQVSVNPAATYDPSKGGVALFTAKVVHPAVPDTSNGGVFAPTGRMTLSEVTLDNLGNVTTTTPVAFTNALNNTIDCQIDAGLTPPNDTVVIGDNGGSGYCPAIRSGSSSTLFRTDSLRSGIHYFVIQYAGDSNFIPASSPVIQYLVSRPLSSMVANSGNEQRATAGTTFAQELGVVIFDNLPGAAPDVPVTFTAPISGASG